MDRRHILEPGDDLQRQGSRLHRRKAKVGDLVRVEGRMRDRSYEKGGETIYIVDRIVEVFGILAYRTEVAG